MVIVLTFSSLTRNHLKEYLSAEAFGQSLSTDLEGGANVSEGRSVAGHELPCQAGILQGSTTGGGGLTSRIKHPAQR
jgi:hypothetical protein